MPRALAQQLQLMGEQIMLARKRRHLSMQDIADRCDRGTLSPLFRGRKVQLLPHDNLASLNNVDTLGQLVAAVEPPA